MLLCPVNGGSAVYKLRALLTHAVLLTAVSPGYRPREDPLLVLCTSFSKG